MTAARPPTADSAVDAIAYFCGFVQTLLYGDFFYYFSKAKATGSAVALPT
jgi:hypothetical protein